LAPRFHDPGETTSPRRVLLPKEIAMSETRETIYRDDLQNLLNNAIDEKINELGLIVAWGYATVSPRMVVPEGASNWTCDWERTDTEADDIARSVIAEFEQRYDMTVR
jgi:hypothetical protein